MIICRRSRLNCLDMQVQLDQRSATGGMKSKLLAAQTALSLGVKVFIGTGSGEQKLADILDGRGDGTYIGDKELSSVNNTRQWIQFHSPISGEIIIDAAAEEAMIHNGSSLLPAGVVGVNGSFPKGAVVEVRTGRRDRQRPNPLLL